MPAHHPEYLCGHQLVAPIGIHPRRRPGRFTFLTLDQRPGYQPNVKTIGCPAGAYTLSFTVGGDPVTHTAQFLIS